MQPSIWGVLNQRWRDTRSRAGFFAALKEIGIDVWDWVLESTPERRRARYGDVEYDWDHAGVDTTSATVSARSRLLAALAGAPYQPTEPTIFAEMIQALEIDPRNFTFIDIGSGKGRTLLMAANFGFKKVIGVELVAEFHEVAVGNISRCGFTNVQSICSDAQDYRIPLEPLVVYLFNPLPAEALKRVIVRLGESLQAQPREIKVLYHNPVSESVLAAAPFLKKICSTYQYAIYSS